MNIGIIVPVRYDSKRLPGKVLKKINSKQVVKYIYERLEQTSVPTQNIVFATSNEESDDIIENFCKDQSYPCYRGSKNNVALRLLNCAKYYDFDAFIRICGDNIFTDKDLINSMIEIFKNNTYDVVTNTPIRTFPYGISVEIIRTKFFDDVYAKFKNSSDFEHVTKYIYDNISNFNVYTYKSNDEKYARVHLALDTQKDFEIITQIINKFTDDHREYNIDDIVDLYYSVTAND